MQIFCVACLYLWGGPGGTQVAEPRLSCRGGEPEETPVGGAKTLNNTRVSTDLEPARPQLDVLRFIFTRVIQHVCTHGDWSLEGRCNNTHTQG